MLTQDEKLDELMKNIEPLIMTSQEYRKLSIRSPYKYVINSGDQFLYYFGDNHSSDPDDSQYNELFKFWKEFVIKTEGRQRIVFIEGGLTPISNTLKEAIRKNSTAGCITYLAKESDMGVSDSKPHL